MEMDIDPYWIVGGGVGIALLGVIAWFYTQRDPKPEELDAAPAHAPEAAPADVKSAKGAPASPAVEAPTEAADKAPTEAGGDASSKAGGEAPPEAAESMVEPPAKPPAEPSAKPPAEPPAEAAAEDAVEAPGEPATEPVAEPDLEPREDRPVHAEAAQATPPVSDEAFDAARAALARALQAGHFSKPDVLHAWAHRDWEAGERKPPRSEYFHQVVKEAVRTRNAFEAMLCDEDRKTFVDRHSQYLDDVAALDDPEAREQAHEAQVRLLAELRPRTPGATEADTA